LKGFGLNKEPTQKPHCKNKYKKIANNTLRQEQWFTSLNSIAAQ
jgi:hypothetical protein